MIRRETVCAQRDRMLWVLTHAWPIVDLSSGGDCCCGSTKAKRSDVWERRAGAMSQRPQRGRRQTGVTRRYTQPKGRTAYVALSPTPPATFPMRESPPHSPRLLLATCPSSGRVHPSKVGTRPGSLCHISTAPFLINPTTFILSDPRSPSRSHRPPRPPSSSPWPALVPERLHCYHLSASLEPRSEVSAPWRASPSTPRWSAG
jgi:hypothetical protein